MTMEDYKEVYELWKTISGFGIRSIDDSYEGVERFLERNPFTSVVAIEDGKIVGSILCGHDGRTGCFYHVCVEKAYRNRGIATQMAEACITALKKENINKATLVAFRNNKMGNACWHELGWTERTDFNQYELILNENNITSFNHGISNEK